MQQKQQILIIGSVWPEPNSTAAGNRMLQLIRVFKSQNWEISFASAASKSEYSYNLESHGITQHHIELNNSSFDEFIKNLQPNIVMFDRFMIEEQFGWRVNQHCPNALTIIDTEDLHCLRFARQEAYKQNKTFSTNDLFSDTAKREIASILRCDASIIISKYEFNLLQSVFKIDKSKLIYTPFLLDEISESHTKKWQSFQSRQHFVSIGNFLHEPNWNSVLYLKETIWPLIKKQLPKAELHIYGAYPSQKVLQLHNEREGLIIKGRAENVASVMSSAKVCLAPLRFGAGLKGKLIDAMLNGTPSVTTEIGAEGMHENLIWPGAIENLPQQFAEKAVELYTNETTWHTAQQAIGPIINTCFSYTKHSETLVSYIEYLSKNIIQHRQENFIGSILNYQHNHATKYMALWIEEKNKTKS